LVKQTRISEGSVTSLSDILLRLPSRFFAPQRLHTAERIKTPTLFMGGDKDFNLTLVGGEQMYQALKSVGMPAELIVYRDSSMASRGPVLFATDMSGGSPGMTSVRGMKPAK
jgi:pimeloyl-ACP methyl ester carboxylesterase